MRSLVQRLFVVVAFITLFAGCGDSPPSSPVKEQIKVIVIDGRNGVEVTDVSIGKWMPGPVEKTFKTDWTAKLKLTEPHGYVLAEVNGRNIVKIVAKEGETLTCSGTAVAEKANDGWHTDAMRSYKEDDDPWMPIAQRTGDLTMGYPVVGDSTRQVRFRSHQGIGAGSMFFPVSAFKPFVEDGSSEFKQLMATETEREQKAQAAALERQRLAKEAADKKRADDQAAAEAKRIADQKAADEKVEAQRVARLLPLLQPLKSAGGTIIVTPAGQPLGILLFESKVDEAALTVSGKGIDLSQMPFQEFTFDGGFEKTGAQQNQLLLRSSTQKDPMAFYAANATGLSGSVRGVSMVSLKEEDRAQLDRAIAAAKRVQSVTPLALVLESMDADAAKTKEPTFKPTPLAGWITHREKASPTLAPIFSGNLSGRKVYSLKPNEILAIRLNEPIKGSGLYIRGSTSEGGAMETIINGIHRTKIDSIPKNGGVFIKLPADLEMLDMRFEAAGAVGIRGIALIP